MGFPLILPQNPVVAGQSGHLSDHNNIAADLLTLWQTIPQGRINVKAPPYNAAGDGVTDDTVAIQSAVNAATAGTVVFFPNGKYEISSPITVTAPIELLGEKAQTGFSAGGSNQTVIDAKAGFTGAAMIITNGTADVVIRNLSIHGNNTTGTTIGIQSITSGSLMLENVLVANTAGDGIFLQSQNPVVMRQVGVFHAGVSSSLGYGINIQGISDSWYTNVLCAGCYSAGWNIQGGNNSQFIGCRAEDSPAGYGFYMHDIGVLRGGTVFTGCSTDLNFADGFKLSNLTGGNGAVQIVDSAFRRDGNNATAGGGGYAGINITGCTMPIIIDGVTVTARQGDSGGADAPQYGISMTTSNLVTVDGSYISCAATSNVPFNHDSTGVLQLGPNLITAGVSASSPTVYQGGEIVLTKTSAQFVNNSTTLVNDTQLVSPTLQPNSTWLVESLIFYDASNAGKIKINWTEPAGAQLLWSGMGAGTGATTAPVTMSDAQRGTSVAYGAVGVGTIIPIIARGRLTIGSTAGPLQFQFAQNTADATNCTIDVGSYLKLKQIA